MTTLNQLAEEEQILLDLLFEHGPSNTAFLTEQFIERCLRHALVYTRKDQRSVRLSVHRRLTALKRAALVTRRQRGNGPPGRTWENEWSLSTSGMSQMLAEGKKIFAEVGAVVTDAIHSHFGDDVTVNQDPQDPRRLIVNLDGLLDKAFKDDQRPRARTADNDDEPHSSRQ